MDAEALADLQATALQRTPHAESTSACLLSVNIAGDRARVSRKGCGIIMPRKSDTFDSTSQLWAVGVISLFGAFGEPHPHLPTIIAKNLRARKARGRV
jgi:hypothetical protein